MVDVLVCGRKSDEVDQVFTRASFDFNSGIANGPTFRDVKNVHGPWDRYIRRCFRSDDDLDEPSEDDKGLKGTAGAMANRSSNSLGVEGALRLITRDDGGIWIPDLLGRTRADLQALVRAYLTAHYSSFVISRQYV